MKLEPLNIPESPRQRKEYIFLELTRSLCSTCLSQIDAKILLVDNAIVMKKWCPQHGEETALLHSDAQWYLDAMKYNRPGDIPVYFPTSQKRGCPYDCGLCPDHEQHTCLALVDITDACNMACPTCFADSRGHSFLTLDQIESAIDGYIQQEGDGGVLQLSGGEPTLHPDIIKAVELALTKPLKVVMINTNGLRMSRDEEFVKRLKDAGEHRLEIYLQFDGLNDLVYEKLRGRKLYDIKMKAIDNLLKHQIPINLTSTIKRGVNEDQVGDIVEFGIRTTGIRGVNFQPACFNGRFESAAPMDRTTNTEIVHLIEQQTNGMFRKTDFIPLPCSFPSQITLTYAYIQKGKVKPIPRFIDLEPYMNQFSNTIFVDPRPIYKKAIEGLWSAGTSFSSAKTLYDFSCVCGIPFKKDFYTTEGRAKIADEHAFRIVLVQFQDKYNWDLKVTKKCCIGQALPDGRIIPFDVYNVLYRKKYEVRYWAESTAESVYSDAALP